MKLALAVFTALVLATAASLTWRSGDDAVALRPVLGPPQEAVLDVPAAVSSDPVIPTPFQESSAVPVPSDSFGETLLNCSLHQPDAFDLSGVIVDTAGQPVFAEFDVVFVPEDGPSKERESRTVTVVGSFSFKKLAAEAGYLVATSRYPHAWIQVRATRAHRGEEGVRIEVDQCSALVGRVHVEEDGFLRTELRARVRHQSARSIHESEAKFESVVDLKSNWSFDFPMIPRGFADVEILLMPMGQVVGRVGNIRVGGGEPVSDVRLDPIVLESPTAIVIELVGARGEPVLEATLKSKGVTFVSTARPFDAHRYYGLESSAASASGAVAAPRTSISWSLRVPKVGLPGVVLAPGYLPMEVLLDRSQTVALKAAPMVTVTLASNLALSNQAYDENSQLEVQVALFPEDAANRTGSAELAHVWFDPVSLIGAMDLRRGERSFRLPTVGAGRYRLEARILSHRGFG
jgi:hypothetical protein